VLLQAVFSLAGQAISAGDIPRQVDLRSDDHSIGAVIARTYTAGPSDPSPVVMKVITGPPPPPPPPPNG
jgi:hypothetical protein